MPHLLMLFAFLAIGMLVTCVAMVAS